MHAHQLMKAALSCTYENLFAVFFVWFRIIGAICKEHLLIMDWVPDMSLACWIHAEPMAHGTRCPWCNVNNACELTNMCRFFMHSR